MIETKKKFKLDISYIEDICKDELKPQSLRELDKKHGLPLNVKCVKEFYSHRTGKPAGFIGKIFLYNGVVGNDNSWLSVERLSDFPEEENPKNIGGENPDSKKFILWETN